MTDKPVRGNIKLPAQQLKKYKNTGKTPGEKKKSYHSNNKANKTWQLRSNSFSWHDASPSALLISVQFVLKDMKPDKKSIEGTEKTFIFSTSFGWQQ